MSCILKPWKFSISLQRLDTFNQRNEPEKPFPAFIWCAKDQNGCMNMLKINYLVPFLREYLLILTSDFDSSIDRNYLWSCCHSEPVNSTTIGMLLLRAIPNDVNPFLDSKWPWNSFIMRRTPDSTRERTIVSDMQLSRSILTLRDPEKTSSNSPLTEEEGGFAENLLENTMGVWSFLLVLIFWDRQYLELWANETFGRMIETKRPYCLSKVSLRGHLVYRIRRNIE